jgi:hypothetical protein
MLGDEEAFGGGFVAHGGDVEEGVEATGVCAFDEEGGGDDVGELGAGLAEGALAGVLADTDEFEGGSTAGGEALVGIDGEGGGERGSGEAGLQGADEEVVSGSAIFGDGGGEVFEEGCGMDGGEGAEAADA